MKKVEMTIGDLLEIKDKIIKKIEISLDLFETLEGEKDKEFREMILKQSEFSIKAFIEEFITFTETGEDIE